MDSITIPNPLRDLPPIKYDLRLVESAENRVNDLKTVNTTNGQELMALFCRAAYSLSKVYSDLQLQLQFAKDRVAHRRAIMLIDEIPPRLKAKGLQDNQMSRQAFLDLDEEYRKASNIHAEIEAAITYVEKQLKATENTLSGIKKIFDAAANVYRRPNPNLTVELGGIPKMVEEAPVDSSPRITVPTPSTTSGGVTNTSNPRIRYGKANYGNSE